MLAQHLYEHATQYVRHLNLHRNEADSSPLGMRGHSQPSP